MTSSTSTRSSTANGGGSAAVEHGHRAVAQLDLAGGQVGVDGALGPGPDRALDGHHVLAAHVDGAGDHALDDAGVVAQVDEGQVLAVLAALGHPAAHA